MTDETRREGFAEFARRALAGQVGHDVDRPPFDLQPWQRDFVDMVASGEYRSLRVSKGPSRGLGEKGAVMLVLYGAAVEGAPVAIATASCAGFVRAEAQLRQVAAELGLDLGQHMTLIRVIAPDPSRSRDGLRPTLYIEDEAAGCSDDAVDAMRFALAHLPPRAWSVADEPLFHLFLTRREP